MWARKGSTSRATSRPTRPCSVRARRHRTPTGGVSMPTAPPTAAPAISRRSRCCATSRSRPINAGPGERLAPLRRGVGFNVSYWFSRSLRLPLGDESLGRRRQAARGRKRPRAEPVRSGRGVRAVALRRAPSLRRERELGAARCPTRAPAAVRADLRRLAAEWDRDPQLRHAVHGLGLGQRRRSRPTARPSRASLPAGPTSSAIRTADRAPSTTGSAVPRFDASTSRPRPASSVMPAGTSRADRPTPTSTCRSCATSRSRRGARCSSAPRSSTSPTTRTSGFRSPTSTR